MQLSGVCDREDIAAKRPGRNGRLHRGHMTITRQSYKFTGKREKRIMGTMGNGTRKLNCWEFKNCGRQPEGFNVESMGLCPATTEEKLDGAHDGTSSKSSNS